jgi:hypothetical protein
MQFHLVLERARCYLSSIMPGRYPLYFLIGASLCVAVPALAASVDGPRLTRFPCGVVHAGDMLDLAWTRPAGEVEEFEVVLSVDGGARYTIRVTPELERYRDHFTWKVPAIDAAHARLSVRYGDESDERLGAPTSEFAIVRAQGAGTAPEVRSAWVTNATQQPLDWWDEADAAPLASTGPALAGDATLAAGSDASRAGILPRRADEGATATAAPSFVHADATPSRLTSPTPSVAPIPLFVPKRE